MCWDKSTLSTAAFLLLKCWRAAKQTKINHFIWHYFDYFDKREKQQDINYRALPNSATVSKVFQLPLQAFDTEMVPKSMCTFGCRSVPSIWKLLQDQEWHTQKNHNIFLSYESHCVTVPPLPKIWEWLCGQIHWRLNWGIRTEKNLPGWILHPQLFHLLCPIQLSWKWI